MTNFIPIFPLSLVVFPGEVLSLHIFEPRYKQLIKDCLENEKPLGIPCVIDNTVKEWGTLVFITELVKEYENGEMDIRTKGSRVFRILEIVQTIPDKLYSGAIVNYPEPYNEADKGSRKLMNQVLIGLHELHKLLKISKIYPKLESELLSFDIGHHVGLTLEQELELLNLFREMERQEYIRRHLQKLIPMIKETEALKEKIKLNGHFRDIKPWSPEL